MAVLLMTVGLVVAVATWRSPEPRPPLVPSRFVPMTSGQGNEVDPALSPDGLRLAYTAAGPDGGSTIWLTTPDGDPHPIPRAEGTHDRGAAWAPDGRRLAFARYSTPQRCDIMLASLPDGASQALGPCGNADEFRMTWSPDGRWLLLSHDPGHGAAWQVARLSVATGERQLLTLPPPNARGDHSPVLSPDGRRLAFIRSTSGAVADLYLAAYDGSQPVRLTRDARDIVGAVWARDGRSLVIASDRAGGYALWRVPIDGGAIAFVAGGGGERIKHPTAALHADTIAYEGWDYEINVWQVPLAPDGEPRPLLTAANQWTFQPAPSPDGRSMAATSTRSGAYEIWLADADGGRARALTSFGGAAAGWPRWSPDGRTLLVSARVGDHAAAFVVPAGGGDARRITPARMDVVAPSWSRDGRFVYFGSPHGGEWQIWRVAADGSGSPVQVTTAGAYAAHESLDGGWLYFTRVDRPGLWRTRLDAIGSETLVTGDLREEDWASWTIGRAGVYYLRRDGGDPSVALIPSDGGGERRVAQLTEMAAGGFAVTPDERALLYARADRRTSNIVKAEFSAPATSASRRVSR